MATPRSERTINRSAAAVIPLFMIAAVVYATWVIVVKVTGAPLVPNCFRCDIDPSQWNISSIHPKNFSNWVFILVMALPLRS